ncbi:sulfotransferase family protein [Panacibacter ginsenosidivorans]|uniref:Sulfotransferase family protein n=1 Tax=Panacibacter ginsenosidivorans TaxID=1813871 RepID=A0A5B8VCT7_9BACT|nr:sulfotransferase family 2 domain-containing protein [Panacibacter ginsenosidivorans]QEC69079.1 sulfotransferase family protein [Panacibacter ginsenosidivorans]
MSLIKNIKRLVKGSPPRKAYVAGNINYDHHYIFIHIPKNAGTSVYKALSFSNSTHAEAKQYKQMLGKSYEDFFSFCFVRNPFDRFISTYNYARLEESYYHSSIDPSKTKFGKHLDYDILKDASLEEAVDLLLEGKLIHDKAWNHWKPQVQWILDEDEKVIVDYIGRLENIQTDFSYICNKLQLPVHNSLPALNVSEAKKKDYRDLINPGMRAKLEHYYRKDLEILEYEF